MMVGRTYTFPPEQLEERERARKLAWLSIALLSIAGVFIFLTLGQSQSMKTAWVSDILTAIPPISLIVAMRYELREPTRRFPYGYFRAIAMAFLVTASVLTLTGAYLLFDSLMKLFKQERPPIGTVEMFGRQFWAGWLMIAALAFSMSVGILLGQLKKRPAKKLHDKELEAESKMNRAEWMSEGAAIVGILLVGLGLWWGDAVAAAFISVEIVIEGWQNVREVIGDLMDEAPSTLGTRELEDLPQKVRARAEELPWVEEAAVRLREQGRVVSGEVFVVPKSDSMSAEDLVLKIDEAGDALADVDWRLHGLTIMPVAQLAGHDPPRIGSLRRPS
jgi:cation diffusion facilitator family transporter